MTRNEIERELNGLYRDLDTVNNVDEQTACLLFNVDQKSEAIQMIQDEISIREHWLAELEEEEPYDVYDDHGFANAADYARWRYGA